MDLSYSDEDGFENYIPTTTDPGPWLFGGTALYSVGCFVMIPILVTIKKKSDNKRNSARLRSGGEEAEGNNGSPPALVSCVDLQMRPTKSTDDNVDRDEAATQVIGPNDEPLQASNSRTGRMTLDAETPSKFMPESSAAPEIENNAQTLSSAEPTIAEQFQMSIDDGGSSNLQGEEEKAEIAEDGENLSILARKGDEVNEPFALEGQSDVNEVAVMQDSQINNATIPALEPSDQHSCCANVFGCTRQKFISCSKDIVKHDKETKRILRLAGPFVMSEVSEVLFEALTVLLVSRYTDVDQLSAYIVTDLLIGTSETLIQGFLETLETVCSHAVGYGNNKLAGQYVQMVATLYTIFSIPIFGMWWFVMGPALRWFGLNAAAVDIGVRYTKLLIFDYLIEGIFEAVGAIPDVTGKERVTNIYQVTHEVIEFAVVWALFAKIEEFDLFWMGVLHLGSALIGFVGFTAVTVKLGWFDPYWEGLTKSFALKNKSAVKYVMKMALPLSIGALFEYGEWELLTIFAASMGQAELAAWGLMESIWDLLEAFAEGFANAGEVRVALQLGRGNIRQAKRSAWKSLFLVTILGIVITILYGVTGEYIVVLYTSDETLQEMLKAMVPIVAFGNVFQAFGSMAWALVGGQGRYHHATIVSSTITTSVSIPLAAFFSLAMDFPLESLVAALVIGYSTVSMCLSYLLITSDWKFISDKIMDEMDDDSSSSSSSEDDSSSSSSDETSGNGEVELVINQENEEESKPYQSSPSLPRSLNSSLIESDYCAGEDTTAESMIIVNIQPQDDTNDQSSVEVSITHQHSMSLSSQSSSSLSREGLAGKPVEHLAVSTAGVSTIPNMKVDLQINGIASTPASPKADEFERGVSSSYLFSPSSSSASSSSFPDMNAKVAFQLQPRIDHEKSNNEGIANGGDSSYAVAEAINASSEAAIIDADDTMTQQNVYSTPPSTPSREKLHPSSPFHSSSSVSNTRRNVVDTIMEEKDPHEVISTPSSSPKS